jgi:hypothetical protein
MVEEDEIRDEHEQEFVPPDPVLEEDAFAELMEAYYGPSLGHTNVPNDETHHESVHPGDHLNDFEADARAPLYEGAQCSRYGHALHFKLWSTRQFLPVEGRNGFILQLQ